jgi:DNA-binding PadR family transcriptional regulator
VIEMPGRKKTWFAVLGLLSWRPMSGYDIKKLVEIGLSHFWSESYGALYPTLNQLVSAGLVKRRSDRKGGGRPRYAYSITPRGQRAFEEWLREPPEDPGVRNEALLKFFLSPPRLRSESLQLLEDYRARQRERYEEYAESEEVLRRAIEDDVLPVELERVLGDSPSTSRAAEPPARRLEVFLLTLRHGVLATQARLAWCDEAVAVLREAARRDDASRGRSGVAESRRGR